MTGPSWLIDSKRIATKIKSASETVDPNRVNWKSNPSKACPRCHYIIDNSDVVHEWPGLPKGVKFDPSDPDLLLHLIAKVGSDNAKPHPFINEFIPTVDEDDGICYTHPQKLPGVKQDGSVSHFFHRTFKAYNTGTRKRRKIHNDVGDIRWHKTGKTKPVIINGKHLGCKKIMVLYMSTRKGDRPEKTNWVMHQYHLGTGEDEKDGEYVVSKIFYQQQLKPVDKVLQDMPAEFVEMEDGVTEVGPASVPVEEFVTEVDSIPALTLSTPKHTADEQHHVLSAAQRSYQENVLDETVDEENCASNMWGKVDDQDNQDNYHTDDTKWWEGESQFLLDSQQLAEGIAICDEFLQSQSSCGVADSKKNKPCLSDYANMGVEDLKKDLEECRNMSSSDHTNLELDTPPDMRLSQLEFGSQDSFLAWAGNKLAD